MCREKLISNSYKELIDNELNSLNSYQLEEILNLIYKMKREPNE